MEHFDVTLDIVEYDGEDIFVLEISGDCAFENAGKLRMKLDSVHRYSQAGVVVDMSGVEMVDSAALALLLHFREHCNQRGCKVVVVPGPALATLLERVSRFSGWFATASTVADAKEAITRQIGLERATSGQ